MGLLFLDITSQGVVMGCDSRDVILTEGAYELPPQSGARRKNRIIPVKATGFTGYLGYVGTEMIGPVGTKTWLERSLANLGDLSLGELCELLAEKLTMEWTAHRLRSGLWIFVAGYEGQQVRFWYVNNISGKDLDPESGLYAGIGGHFAPVNDLDGNYIKKGLESGKTKDEILTETIFNFRNGVIFPFVVIYDAFNEVLKRLHASEPGFARLNTLEKLAFIARQRLELVKRLYSEKHGIYDGLDSPIGGDVFVFAMDPTGRRWRCHKNRFGEMKL